MLISERSVLGLLMIRVKQNRIGACYKMTILTDREGAGRAVRVEGFDRAGRSISVSLTHKIHRLDETFAFKFFFQFRDLYRNSEE